MSRFSENFDKAALGGAVLIAGGLAFTGWQKLSSVEEQFGDKPAGQPTAGGKNDPSVKGADAVVTAKSSFDLDRRWQRGDDNGRPVDLFTGIALFVNKNDQQNPLDFFKGEPVHPPIPNSWWIDNRIDPGFGDSPQRDEDEDGFTNLEEYEAKTDPKDASDYPPLITKLMYVGDESTEWVLRPGFEDAKGSFTFNYGDGKRNNRAGAANPVPIGGIFFDDDPAKGRFKFLGAEKQVQVNEAIRAEVEVTIVKVEDQKPNKKGIVYELPANFRIANQRQFAQFDRTAVLSLDALGLAGQEIKIEENTVFALPPGAKSKAYKITQVTPERVGIEFTGKDGKVLSYEILKGETGPTAP
jgi:hypothetical protein